MCLLPSIYYCCASVLVCGFLAAWTTRLIGVLQVFLRVQWVQEVVRGQSQHVEVNLAGLGTSVMGTLQDELFNITIQNLQVCMLSFKQACIQYVMLCQWECCALSCNTFAEPSSVQNSQVCLLVPAWSPNAILHMVVKAKACTWLPVQM